ncbi:MAG: hypothetical protein AAF558_00780 [Verrucomicrobiota bacterium]
MKKFFKRAFLIYSLSVFYSQPSLANSSALYDLLLNQPVSEEKLLREKEAGIRVTRYFLRSAADRAGLRDQDIIVGYGKYRVYHSEDLKIARWLMGEPSELSMIVFRGDQLLELSLQRNPGEKKYGYAYESIDYNLKLVHKLQKSGSAPNAEQLQALHHLPPRLAFTCLNLLKETSSPATEDVNRFLKVYYSAVIHGSKKQGAQGMDHKHLPEVLGKAMRYYAKVAESDGKITATLLKQLAENEGISHALAAYCHPYPELEVFTFGSLNLSDTYFQKQAEKRFSNILITPEERQESERLYRNSSGNEAERWMSLVKLSLVDEELHGGWPFRHRLLNDTQRLNRLVDELYAHLESSPRDAALVHFCLMTPLARQGDTEKMSESLMSLQKESPLLASIALSNVHLMMDRWDKFPCEMKVQLALLEFSKNNGMIAAKNLHLPFHNMVQEVIPNISDHDLNYHLVYGTRRYRNQWAGLGKNWHSIARALLTHFFIDSPQKGLSLSQEVVDKTSRTLHEELSVIGAQAKFSEVQQIQAAILSQSDSGKIKQMITDLDTEAKDTGNVDPSILARAAYAQKLQMQGEILQAIEVIESNFLFFKTISAPADRQKQREQAAKEIELWHLLYQLNGHKAREVEKSHIARKMFARLLELVPASLPATEASQIQQLFAPDIADSLDESLWGPFMRVAIVQADQVRILEGEPASLPIYMSLIESFENRVERFPQLTPLFLESIFMLDQVLEATGHIQKRYRMIEKALARSPEQPAFLIRKVMLDALWQGKLEPASAELDRIIKSNPNFYKVAYPHYMTALVTVYGLERKYKEAAQFLHKSFEEHSRQTGLAFPANTPSTHLAERYIHYKIESGSLESVEGELKKLLLWARERGWKNVEPDFQMTYANFLEKSNRPQEAIQMNQFAVEQNFALRNQSKALLARADLARRYALLGNINHAKALWQSILSMMKEDRDISPWRHYELLSAYAEFLKVTSSQKEIEAANVDFHNRLEQLELSNHLKNELIQSFPEKAVALQPENEEKERSHFDLQPLAMTTGILPGDSAQARFSLVNLGSRLLSGTVQLSGPSKLLDWNDTEKTLRFQWSPHLKTADSDSDQRVVLEPNHQLLVYIDAETTASAPMESVGTVSLTWRSDDGNQAIATWDMQTLDDQSTTSVVNANLLTPNPFYGLPVFHEFYYRGDGAQVQNFRMKSNRPCRLEYYNERDGEIIAVDANGNGIFNEPGDIIYQDSDFDQFPDLTLSEENPVAAIEVLFFQAPSEESIKEDIILSVELSNDAGWTKSAENIIQKEEK